MYRLEQRTLKDSINQCEGPSNCSSQKTRTEKTFLGCHTERKTDNFVSDPNRRRDSGKPYKIESFYKIENKDIRTEVRYIKLQTSVFQRPKNYSSRD